MKFHPTLVSTAVVLALTQLQAGALADPSTPATAPAPAATAVTVKPPIAAKSPEAWIQYEDTTFTPVVDDVSAHLAAARAALAAKDGAKAADALQAVAAALKAQGERAAKADLRQAAADLQAAKEAHVRMTALSARLGEVAQQIRAGKVPNNAALDDVLGAAGRADLERRWLVTDVTTWYPVAEEPQRHFLAAADAYAKRQFKAAADEVQKAAAYIRLEAARAMGAARQALADENADLQKLAQDLRSGVNVTDAALDRTFAKASHALALAHREQAARSWSSKAFDEAGYELKAAAHGLESAARWADAHGEAAIADATAGARALGEKLASGGVWAKAEVTNGFEALGNAINRLGQSVGSQRSASPFDEGA